MTGTRTRAVPLEVLAAADPGGSSGQPLCPGCRLGYLHPFLVEVDLGAGWEGVSSLSGWVASCVGDEDYNETMARLRGAAGVVSVGEVVGSRPCGFVMPLTPKPRRFSLSGWA